MAVQSTSEHYRQNLETLNSLTPGDLIEFQRPHYTHWAVYIGNGKVIHRSAPDDDGLGVASALSASSDVVSICQADYWTVVGLSKARKNNVMDDKWKPYPPQEIVKRAKSKMGETGYSLFSSNCEHFVNWCRYGENHSEQVKGLVDLGLTLAANYLDKGKSLGKKKDNADVKMQTVDTTSRDYQLNLETLNSLSPGDLVEFPRIGHSHWAVYVGNGKVIHRSEGPEKGTICEEDFWAVVGRSKAWKNNAMDGKWKPFKPQEIVKRAKSRLGEKGYQLFTSNSEHFVNWCRYDENRSRQVDELKQQVASLFQR